MPSDLEGFIDYEKIKEKIKAIIDARDFKVVVIDSDGNIVGDIPLSTLARTRVYEQSFEDGTSDLTADNATQTVQSDEVYSGSYALQVTISAGQTGYVETPVRHVSPNQEITVVFAHKEDANITDVKLIVVWYRTNMRELATEEFTLDVSDTWKLESRTVTAPKKVAYMAVRIQATAGSSDGNVYVGDITIDLVGQIFRVDGAGQIKVTDTDLLDEMQTKLDVALSTLAKLQRWGRNVEPVWIHGDEVTEPAANTKLVSVTVSSGKKGYIYGFFIMAGEANDFKINWTSGGETKSIRIPFSSGGALQYVDIVPLNEGLPADGGTEISITNVNAGSSGVVYQARLLYVEV